MSIIDKSGLMVSFFINEIFSGHVVTGHFREGVSGCRKYYCLTPGELVDVISRCTADPAIERVSIIPAMIKISPWHPKNELRYNHHDGTYEIEYHESVQKALEVLACSMQSDPERFKSIAIRQFWTYEWAVLNDQSGGGEPA